MPTRDRDRMFHELQRMGAINPPRMGEAVALDRYGAMKSLLPQRMSKDPAVDRVLREAAPGYELEDVRSGRYYPDAADNQRPPPMPPTLQEQPAWSREPADIDTLRGWVQPYTPDEDWA